MDNTILFSVIDLTTQYYRKVFASPQSATKVYLNLHSAMVITFLVYVFYFFQKIAKLFFLSIDSRVRLFLAMLKCPRTRLNARTVQRSQPLRLHKPVGMVWVPSPVPNGECCTKKSILRKTCAK